MKVKALMTTFEFLFEDRNEVGTESIDVPIGQDAENWITRILFEFNEEEYKRNKENNNYKLHYRKFLKIVKTGEKVDATEWTCLRLGDIQTHKLTKLNLTTIGKGGISYDHFQCINCKLQFQVKQLGMLNILSDKVCRPKNVCPKCNKEYNSIRTLQSHRSKNKHKIPEWCNNS
jgi:hypothetical protein